MGKPSKLTLAKVKKLRVTIENVVDQMEKLDRLLDFTHEMVSRSRESAYQGFCRRLATLTQKGLPKKRTGRPLSKVTSSGFKRRVILETFDINLRLCLRALRDRHYDLSQLETKPWLAKADLYSAFVNSEMGSGKAAIAGLLGGKDMFEQGARFGMIIARSIVLEITLQDLPSLLDLKGNIEFFRSEMQRLRPIMKQDGFSNQEIEDYVKKGREELPSGLRRKYLKSDFSQADVARFTNAVKDHDGIAYVKEIAKDLGLDRTGVMALYDAAKRQKKKISLERNSKGDFFLM